MIFLVAVGKERRIGRVLDAFLGKGTKRPYYLVEFRVRKDPNSDRYSVEGEVHPVEDCEHKALLPEQSSEKNARRRLLMEGDNK